MTFNLNLPLPKLCATGNDETVFDQNINFPLEIGNLVNSDFDITWRYWEEK